MSPSSRTVRNRTTVFSPSLRAASLALLPTVAAAAPASAQQPLPYQLTATGAIGAVATLPGPPPLVEEKGTGTVTGSLGLTGDALDLFADFSTGLAFGTLTYTTAAGDTLYAYTRDDQGVFPAPGSGVTAFTFSGTETFLGGTGIFAGASGRGTYTGAGVLTATGNTFVYTSRGNIVLTPVPESGTASFIIAGLLPLALAAARRRKTLATVGDESPTSSDSETI